MDKLKRPKLDLPKTRSERLMDVIGAAALLTMLAVLLLNWTGLPDQVPAHFDGKGNVDRWGSKLELLILPGIAVVMHFFLKTMEKYPETHNYPARLNDGNRAVFYTHSRQTMNYMRNLINLLFAYIVWRTIVIALGDETSIGWPFFVLLGSLGAVVVWQIVRMVRIK